MSNAIVINGLIGKLDKRTLQTGDAVMNFSVASKTGKDETTWFNCSAFGKTAEFIEKFFSVGSGINVVGQMNSREYEKDGQKRTVMEVKVNSVAFSAGGKKEEKDEPSTRNDMDDDQSIPF